MIRRNVHQLDTEKFGYLVVEIFLVSRFSKFELGLFSESMENIKLVDKRAAEEMERLFEKVVQVGDYKFKLQKAGDKADLPHHLV